MRNTHSRLRYTGARLLLAIGISFPTFAQAGQGVWTSGGPDNGYIAAVAVDPKTSSTLYAAAVSALYKSTDSGRTWAFTPSSSVFYVYYSALAINPSTPSTLYAGSEEFGVQRSTDGGGTWTAFTGLGGGVSALAIDPATPSTLYAGGGGVFKSTDSGGTWTAANVGLTYLDIRALSINPAAPNTLYAGSYGGGVFRSTNGGGTWIAANAGLTNLVVNALAINPTTPTTLYAGSDGGVFKSTDSGETWALASAGLPNPSPGSPNRRVLALVINPTAPDTLHAGSDGGGVFSSTDGGGTWIAISAGLPSVNLFNGPPGIFVSSLALDPTGKTTLYAGLSLGVWQMTGPSNGPSPTTFLLPASAHAPGASGAFYTTNVAVANVGAAPASFTMKFLGHDQDGSGGPEQTFSLESGKTVTYLDVLDSVFHETSAFGAIRITSDTPSLDVVSVTSTPGFGGTLSQTIPAVSSSNLIPAGSQRSILYIREGDGFRSNLVLASNAGVSTTVDAVLLSAEGAVLAAKSYTVPANGMTQINRIVRDTGVSGPVTGARLVLSSSTPGAAFTAFVSVIDEITNDPTAVEAN